jgi:hypothetical protein
MVSSSSGASGSDADGAPPMVMTARWTGISVLVGSGVSSA